jgi:glycosyltransferase involved in cell wall biosynthesis
MRRLDKKLAVVSHVLPPVAAGTAMRIWRLFGDTDPRDYGLITCRDFNAEELPAQHFRLPAEWRQFHFAHPKSFVWFANVMLRLAQRSRNLARLVRGHGFQAVLAFSGDLLDLPSAALAARRARVPFYAAMDDYYSRQWPDTMDAWFARRAEGLVLRSARKAIVLNDSLLETYGRQYGVECALVYNPCDDVTQRLRPRTQDSGDVAIVFTGSVYHANHDALRRLVQALAHPENMRVKLHIYTAQAEAGVRAAGIIGPVIIHPPRSPREIAEVQAAADILFLPLAFEGVIPEVIRTSAPFKMGEYLASGSPILVHAPKDSFLAWYFRTHGCGVVVDRPDQDELARAIVLIARDGALRDRLRAAQERRAAVDFTLSRSRAAFFAALA